MLNLWFTASPRKPREKGLSDFSWLWYLLCHANSGAQDADERLGRQQALSCEQSLTQSSPSPGLSGRASVAVGGPNAHDGAVLSYAYPDEAVLEKAISARLRQPREEREKFLWPTMVLG